MNQNKWVEFTWTGFSPSGKTSYWECLATVDSTVLGEVRWFGRWRQYCFYPTPDTIWNADCLAEVSRFLDKVNREHQENK